MVIPQAVGFVPLLIFITNTTDDILERQAQFACVRAQPKTIVFSGKAEFAFHGVRAAQLERYRMGTTDQAIIITPHGGNIAHDQLR
ncbi:hypothetical protein D3C81_1878760 [compost metagenome]